MRLLVDECTGPMVALWLRDQGHEVYSVFHEARGLDDSLFLDKAFSENWILITTDRVFGEKVFREHLPHRGVVFLRLLDERPVAKIEAIRKLLESYADQLEDDFVVVTDFQVRFSKG